MELLKKLCVPAVCGYEDALADVIKEQLDKAGISYFQDSNKSIIAHIAGTGEPAMFLAAMDTPGVFITYIEDNGFLRFSPAGRIEESDLLGKSVILKSGIHGIISGGEKFADMFIDIGAKNKAEAEDNARISDFAALPPSLSELGSMLSGYRAGKTAILYAMLEGAQKIKAAGKNAYFVFVSKTAHTPSHAFLNMLDTPPSLAYLLDTSHSLDTPGQDNMPVRLGNGVTLKIMDGSIISSAKAVSYIESIKEAAPLFYREVTDKAGFFPKFQSAAINTDTAAIGLPVRYKGAYNEVLEKSDIDCLIKLISLI